MKFLTAAMAIITIISVSFTIMLLSGPYGGGPVTIKPGDAVEESDPEEIEELSIAAKDWRLVAYKWSEASKDFQISFFWRGQAAPETCRAGDKFLALLSKISTLRAARVCRKTKRGAWSRTILANEFQSIISWWGDRSTRAGMSIVRRATGQSFWSSPAIFPKRPSRQPGTRLFSIASPKVAGI